MSKSFAKYETRKTINKGARLELADPTTGEATGDWLKIRYSLADDYAMAREEVERSDAITGAQDSGSVERTARYLAPLIADWSFDEPCTPENVFEFLCIAPHVHGAIVQKATLEGKLYVMPVTSFANGQEPSSLSTGSQKVQQTE